MSQTIQHSSQRNKVNLLSISDDTKDFIFNEVPRTTGSFSYSSPKKKPSNLLRSEVSSKVGGEMRVSGPSLETKDEMTRNLHINQILANISRATRNGDVALVKVLNNSLRILKNQGTDTQNLNLFQTKKVSGVDVPLATNNSQVVPDGKNTKEESVDLSNNSNALRPIKVINQRNNARKHHASVITRSKIANLRKVREDLFSELRGNHPKTTNTILRKRRARPTRGGMGSDIAFVPQKETQSSSVLSHKNEFSDVPTEDIEVVTSLPVSPVVEQVKPLEKGGVSPDNATNRLQAANKVLGVIMGNVAAGENMIARLISPFGFHVNSDLMTPSSHPGNLPTKKSWRDFLDSGDMSQFVNDLMMMSEEDFITMSVPGYVNPSNPSSWSSVSSFNTYEIFNSPNAVYGLTPEQRGEVSSLLKNLGIIDQTIDMNLTHKKYGVAPSYVADYQDYFAKYPKTTVHMYYGEVRSRVALADKDTNN